MNLTGNRIVSVIAYFAVSTVYSHRDVVAVESMTINRQILASTCVSCVRTDVENDRDCLDLVARAVIKMAMGDLLLCFTSIAYFPEHFYTVIVANR